MSRTITAKKNKRERKKRPIKQQSCYAHTQHLIIPKAESTLHTARRFTGKGFRKKEENKN
jgi:hypothetical protein